MNRILTLLACSTLIGAGSVPVHAQDMADMTFFVTSVGPGNGADLGGLDGADAYCASLAETAGAGGKTWRAYLSTSSVNARDRIGAGPWQNAKGDTIAASVDELHGDANNLTKETALSEKGEVINGRGDDPNRHDILTGSNTDGTAAAETCNDWTNSGEGSAIVGHSDRMGLDTSPPALSWNSSHPSRGCSQEALRGTGGDGLIYCFAAN
jgi:hypothetical protein